MCTSLLRLIMRYIAKSGLMLRGTDNISLARFISCSRSLQTTKRKLIFATLFWNCCSNSFSVMPHFLRKATGTYIYVTSCFLSSVNATTYTEYKNVSGIRSFSNLPAFCSISSVPAICSTLFVMCSFAVSHAVAVWRICSFVIVSRSSLSFAIAPVIYFLCKIYLLTKCSVCALSQNPLAH